MADIDDITVETPAEGEAENVVEAVGEAIADVLGLGGEGKGEDGERKAGDEIYWVTNASDVIPLNIGEEGAAAEEPETMFQVFQRTVKNHSDKPAFFDAQMNATTWQEYYNQCLTFGKACIKVGVEPFEAVNMIGFNAPEYFIADVGGIMAGAIAAGIYTTNDAQACQYVSEHSDAAVVMCEGPVHLQKYYAIYDSLPKLKALVMYGEGDVPEAPEGCVPVYTFEAFMKLGAEVEDAEIEARMAAQVPGNCCSLIYTSGTTGPPKAVMISHDNITWTARRVQKDLELTCADRIVSFLPLNHIAAQMLDIHSPMAFGYPVYFADKNALKGSLRNTLCAARPTIFFGVPRVWEKFREAMLAAGASVTGCKRSLANWAKKKGAERAANAQYGKSGNTPACYGCANSIVLSKVKDRIGLDKCRIAATGAAPISMEVLEYFGSLDIHILELFGQSETTGPASFNYPSAWKMGTCGKVMDGTDLRIVPDTKEIIYRGRHVFMGYMKMVEKTAETFDEQGYLHSGDQGKIDEDGFLSIIGRIKELIITAGGENIPPVLIEDVLKEELPVISNACVIGDRKKYLTVLVSLKTDVNADTGEPEETLAGDAKRISQEIGSEALTVAAAAECEKWTEYITAGLKRANERAVSRAQRVQKFRILPVDFSVPGGELTATLKVKRSVVHGKYEELIEAMYAE